MSPEFLSAICAVLLSLCFSYIPGLNSWFDQLDGIFKRLIMLGLLLIVSIVAFGLSCLGWGAPFNITLTCDQAGLIVLIKSFGLAVISNQSTWLISPRK